MTTRLTTRGPATAAAIAERTPFTTAGGLSAGSMSGAGRLDRHEVETYYCDQPTYVVYSYATPIAWWSEDHGWHRVSQRFSVTTSRHQGVLYMIEGV